MLISNERYFNTNFRAVKVATVVNTLNNRTNCVDIYKLSQTSTRDSIFIEKLKDKINFERLCPHIPSTACEKWGKVFNYCIERFKNGDKTYIAMAEDNPRGIMAYNGDKFMSLEGICSIPDTHGKKFPRVGMSLFYQLFNEAIDLEAKSIKLEAVNDGPFDVVRKYEKLGFKIQKGIEVSKYTDMVSNKYNTKTQLKNLANELEYIQSDSEEIVDLNPYID